MLELNFIEEYLKETVHAIKSLVKNKKVITVKSVRGVNNIKSSNRSKIHFIWRALDRLVEKDYLKHINDDSPKIYKLTSLGEKFIDKFTIESLKLLLIKRKVS